MQYAYSGVSMMDDERKACIRCGTCCQGSTPSLHPEDITLIDQGVIALGDLVTLRSGEVVYDNIQGKVRELTEELVKVREQDESQGCLFYDPRGAGCGIYDNRPLQCRTLECWNPEKLIGLFESRKINRTELIGDDAMNELVAAHEERASVSRLKTLLLSHSEENNREGDIVDLVNYDLHFREFLAGKLSLGAGETVFYFGRPLLECMTGFGFEVSGSGKEGFYLVPLKD